MNELAQSISQLYKTDSSPVIGISGGRVAFFNPAAKAVFPNLETDKHASDVLPDSFLRCDDLAFVTTARIVDHSVSACGVWYSGMLLLRLNMDPTRFEFSPESMTAGMRSDLAAMRIALEQMGGDTDDEFLKAHGASLAVLRHSYYKLLRRCENLSLAYTLTNRVTVFKPLLLDPVEWLSGLTEQLAAPLERMGVKLQFAHSEKIGDIPADRELLEQMTLNLVSNAARQLGPGGVITFRLRRQGRRLLFTVDDSGPGFSDELLGGLYQRSVLQTQNSLFQRERMGLLIVWGVADLHGGAVTISNRANGGARVRIALPTEHSGSLPLYSPSEPYQARYPKNEHVLTALADVLPDECYPFSVGD